MWRAILLSSACLALSACMSTNTRSPSDLLAQAESETKLRRDIDTLTTYAVAKYAGYTEDADTVARNYSRLLRNVQDDPWLAEQGDFAMQRVGEVDRAIAAAKRLPYATVLETELPRLLLAVDALKNEDTTLALTYLTKPWTND